MDRNWRLNNETLSYLCVGRTSQWLRDERWSAISLGPRMLGVGGEPQVQAAVIFGRPSAPCEVKIGAIHDASLIVLAVQISGQPVRAMFDSDVSISVYWTSPMRPAGASSGSPLQLESRVAAPATAETKSPSDPRTEISIATDAAAR